MKVLLTFAYILIRVSCAVNTAAAEVQHDAPFKELEKPLILTPYLKEGKIQDAREASAVKFTKFEPIRSFAGYFTVDAQFNSNIFFWFFPAQKGYETAPVAIWLQGGPGMSSLLGLFVENGPFIITKEQDITLRHHSWAQNYSIVYIDNPVGAGYSFTNPGGHAKNETIIGEHLYEFMLQFMQLFPETKHNEVFIFGESYGAKFALTMGHAIYRNLPNTKINLRGITIVSGFCAIEYQLVYADYLYNIGLLDLKGWTIFKSSEEEILNYIKKKEWTKAGIAMDMLLLGDVVKVPTTYKNLTNANDYFNYLNLNPVEDKVKETESFVLRSDVRSAIHVGNATYHGERGEAKLNLMDDLMQSTAELIEELLPHYKILFVSGQLDIVVPYPSVENLLRNLQFEHAEEYKKTDRQAWYVDSKHVGYVKQAGNLSEVLVFNAGHLVPTDQPHNTMKLIDRFIGNLPLNVA